MSVNKELVKGSTSMLVLGVLEEKEMYGYQIIKELEQRSETVFSLKEGTLYPILHVLEQDGFLEAYWEDTSSARKRRFYRITKKGRKELDRQKEEWKMKKLRMFSVILLVVSATAYFGFQVYSKVTRDNTPPVVTCDSEELRVSVSQPEEDLLKGVKAVDDRSGDVKDTLVIEEISDFTEEGPRIITYAAVDESKNVGRMERTLVYEDYQAPVFDMSNGLCFTAGSNVDILGRISAESVIDGDLTSKIKY